MGMHEKTHQELIKLRNKTGNTDPTPPASTHRPTHPKSLINTMFFSSIYFSSHSLNLHYKYPNPLHSPSFLLSSSKKSHLIQKSPSTLVSFYKMDPYMDEKWKLSKRGSRNYSSSKREQPTSTSGSYLKRSSSMPETIKAHRRPSSSSAASTAASGAGRSSFSSRCANLVKEQRAKFYIMRRCVTMLMCWRDYP